MSAAELARLRARVATLEDLLERSRVREERCEREHTGFGGVAGRSRLPVPADMEPFGTEPAPTSSPDPEPKVEIFAPPGTPASPFQPCDLSTPAGRKTFLAAVIRRRKSTENRP